MRRALVSGRATVILSLAAILAVAGGPDPANAAWSGQEVTRDGELHVMNPATPVAAPTVVSPREQWRAGGDEDEDVIFGVLSSVASDADGTLYLLDQQLNEVMVFSKDGEYLRSIGREGEGPGEFRRPSGLFLTPDGNVAVLQSMPGRIILLTRDGEPVGNHPAPEAPDRGMMMFFRGDLAGSRIILDTGSFSRSETGMSITREIIAIDSQGKELTKYYEDTNERSFANGSVFDEKEMQSMMWACGKDGRVYVSDGFDNYRIRAYNADGSLDRVIETAYTHRKRSKEEMEKNRPRVMFRRRGGGAHSPDTKASETDRDILGIYPRDDGTLWVLSSHGGNDAPDGAIGTFDVYDRDGRFASQVTVKGEGDMSDDGVHFVGDRMVVVRGFRSAQRAQLGGDDDAAADDGDVEPMAVICYDLGQIVQGRN